MFKKILLLGIVSSTFVVTPLAHSVGTSALSSTRSSHESAVAPSASSTSSTSHPEGDRSRRHRHSLATIFDGATDKYAPSQTLLQAPPLVFGIRVQELFPRFINPFWPALWELGRGLGLVPADQDPHVGTLRIGDTQLTRVIDPLHPHRQDIASCAGDHDGSLLVGTCTGLVRLDGFGVSLVWNSTEGVESIAVMVDRSVVWATPVAIYRRDTNGVTTRLVTLDLEDAVIESIGILDDSSVVYGTSEGDIGRIDAVTGKSTTYVFDPTSEPSIRTRTCLGLHHGSLECSPEIFGLSPAPAAWSNPRLPSAVIEEIEGDTGHSVSLTADPVRGTVVSRRVAGRDLPLLGGSATPSRSDSPVISDYFNPLSVSLQADTDGEQWLTYLADGSLITLSGNDTHPRIIRLLPTPSENAAAQLTRLGRQAIELDDQDLFYEVRKAFGRYSPALVGDIAELRAVNRQMRSDYRLSASGLKEGRAWRHILPYDVMLHIGGYAGPVEETSEWFDFHRAKTALARLDSFEKQLNVLRDSPTVFGVPHKPRPRSAAWPDHQPIRHAIPAAPPAPRPAAGPGPISAAPASPPSGGGERSSLSSLAAAASAPSDTEQTAEHPVAATLATGSPTEAPTAASPSPPAALAAGSPTEAPTAASPSPPAALAPGSTADVASEDATPPTESSTMNKRQKIGSPRIS